MPEEGSFLTFWHRRASLGKSQQRVIAAEWGIAEMQLHNDGHRSVHPEAWWNAKSLWGWGRCQYSLGQKQYTSKTSFKLNYIREVALSITWYLTHSSILRFPISQGPSRSLNICCYLYEPMCPCWIIGTDIDLILSHGYLSRMTLYCLGYAM
jgi:hypothetical protein